jgi:signal transduction histidine kinase
MNDRASPVRRSTAVPFSPPDLDEGRASKASFLRMVSHELRTPLNSIIGFSELLGGEPYGPLGAPEYREYAGIIHESGQRLLTLVNQIVDVVRLQDGVAQLELTPQRLDHAIDDALETVAAEAKARAETIEVDWPPEPLWVAADAQGLRVILSNLLQNAVAFSPEGARTAVRCARRGDRVRIEIEDHGGGVALEDIPRLLRPFEQGENALTRHTDGAGLGLTIVRLLCEAMDGSLMLDSRPGVGLTTVVDLPAAEPPPPAPAVAGEPWPA